MKTDSVFDKTNAQGHHTLAFLRQSPNASGALMGKLTTFVSCLFMMAVAVGCASTKVTSREELVTGQLPRPGHIWVYDFIATASDVPADSALAGQYDLGESETPQTVEQITTGKKLGSEMAVQLVKRIRGMGLPAENASTHTIPQINDVVIRGYLLSIEKGSAAKRFVVGFGAGGSELRTMVEGFQVTAQGPHKFGSETVDSSGNKTPGTALGVATLLTLANPAGLIIGGGVKAYGEATGSAKVEGRAKQSTKQIADVLKEQFRKAGWIK